MSVKKAAGFAIKLVVTVGLFVLLFRPETFGLPPDQFHGVKPGDMLREVREAGAHNVVFWLTFAAVVKLAGMLAGVLRWRLLLHGQGIRMPFWYMVQSWFVGRFIGIFLPGTIGLDGYRLYDSCRYTGEVIKCTTVIAVEKLIGFIALTGLVFLTFPLGFRLLNVNVPMLVVILAVLGSLVAVFFLLLLNPRVIQVLVAVVPTPGVVRNKFNKLGAAVTAYSGNRADLLLAVLLGVIVHVGTCFMYFGTMMAIRAANTNLLDILFASPLMIYGTVLGPSVGGEGIREIVFVTLLSAKSGAAAALTFAHLGWWVGEVVPFLIGLPIYVLRSRPAKEQLEAELAQARQQAAEAEEGLHLAPEVVADYRNRLVDCVLAGVLAGLIAGGLVGLVEAGWVARTLEGLHELAIFWWGPLVYGILFAPVGLAVAAALAFLYLLVSRFAPAAITFALSLGGALAAGTLIIGRFRFQRDVLEGHGLTPAQNGMVLVAALGIGLAAALVAGLVLWIIRGNRVKGIAGGVVAYLALIAVGGALSAVLRPDAEAAVAFAPKMQATGPNIVFVVVDALRADYLALYSDAAVAKTPQLAAFRHDAVLFTNCFAQSTWTKPSFATLFSGLYPETHTATSKVSHLPDDIQTVAEVLYEGGYHTKGFSNNPHIMNIFNFGQGFVDYTDLKPDVYYFGATLSASKLSLYDALRRAKQNAVAEIPFWPKKLVVTEFYQPAEVVTGEALDWLDSGAVPEGVPFYLFLHYMDPHDPFMDADKPGVGYARVRLGNPDPSLREPMQKAYNDEIEYLDTYLSELFDGLRRRGLYDDALIVFTADHGEEFYDHEGWWHGQTLYDELMHVPLIVKLPGNARRGQTNAYLARHVDIPVTFIHFAGLKRPEAMPGKALFGENNTDANADTLFVYAELDFENNILQGVRTYDTKVIHANADNPRRFDPVEFYDLAADPLEHHNLAGQQNPRKDDQQKLEEVLEGMLRFTRENAAVPVLDSGMTSDIKQRLEALGYLD